MANHEIPHWQRVRDDCLQNFLSSTSLPDWVLPDGYGSEKGYLPVEDLKLRDAYQKGIWCWYEEQVGIQELRAVGPPAYLGDGRYTRSQTYLLGRLEGDLESVAPRWHSIDDEQIAALVSYTPTELSDAKTELSDANFDSLLVVDAGGFLCGVIRQCVNAKGGESLLDSLEQEPSWNEIVEQWPASWKLIGKDFDDVPRCCESQLIFNPVPGEWTFEGLCVAGDASPDGLFTQVQQHLARASLPWDDRTTAYTIYRILGGDPGKVKSNDDFSWLRPVRGGWVTTLVIAQYPILNDASREVRVVKNYGDSSEIREIPLVKPQIIQSTQSFGSWMLDEHWDTEAGRVKLKHRAWVMEQGSFVLPKNLHEVHGRLPSLVGTTKRGRARKNPEYWDWWENELSGTLSITEEQIEQKAKQKCDALVAACGEDHRPAIRKMKNDIRRWIQTSLRNKGVQIHPENLV